MNTVLTEHPEISGRAAIHQYEELHKGGKKGIINPKKQTDRHPRYLDNV